MGINIRYIGYICENTKNVFVKTRLEIEMIARALKKIIRNFLAENHFAVQNFIENKPLLNDKSETTKNISEIFQLSNLDYLIK